MNPELSSRPASAADDDFLYRLYASTRMEEISAWGWPPQQQEIFLRMQFNARRHSYASSYPSAQENLLLKSGVPVGAMIFARTSSDVRLLDIALLPEHRNRGLGAIVLSNLM